MLRHKRTVHTDDFETKEEENEMMSDSTEEPEINEREQSISESMQSSDNEEDPWDEIVDDVFEECQSEYEDKVKDLMDSEDIDKETARSTAYKEMRPIYRKSLSRSFIEKMIWYNIMKQDRTFRAIKSTAIRLKEDEDYGIEEAWKYSVSKRKYLFDDILKQYMPPPVNDSEDMDTDNEEDQDGDSGLNGKKDSNICEI